MRLLILPVCLLIYELPALSQAPHLSFGVIGGVRLSEGAPASFHDESPRYTLGPAFEVTFGEHLAVECNALYKRLGGSNVTLTSVGAGSSELFQSIRTRAHSWEFPILGKYYFGRRIPRDRFFVATGYSFQRSWTSSSYYAVLSDTPPGMSVHGASLPGSRPPIVVGAAFGVGVARKAGPLTLAPAFRYTHWGSRADGASRNQTEMLLALTF